MNLSIPVCTFCKAANVDWAYPIASFVVVIGDKKSLNEDCFACDGCHELIQKGDLIAVAERTTEGFILSMMEREREEEMTNEIIEWCLQQSLHHHQQFVAAMTGDAIPVSKELM